MMVMGVVMMVMGVVLDSGDGSDDGDDEVMR